MNHITQLIKHHQNNLYSKYNQQPSLIYNKHKPQVQRRNTNNRLNN